MLKALLLNSTRYLQGSGTGGTLPSNNQGWGDANLGLLFDGTPRVLVDQSRLFAGSGQEQFYHGSIMNPSKPFRVTLVWTDPPGSTTGSSYVNNLDLEVTVGGVTYKGNVFSGAYSTSGGTADARNNVESVFLPAGVGGAYTVRVVATNLAGDGVPGAGTATDQDFALVIYNISIGPAGTLTGQVRDANTAAPQADALIGISSTPTQTYNLSSDASGNYSILLPVATYTVTAAKYGYLPATLTGVSIVSGTTTTQNISLTPAATYVISGFVKDSATHDPLWATINVVGAPFNPPVDVGADRSGHRVLQHDAGRQPVVHAHGFGAAAHESGSACNAAGQCNGELRSRRNGEQRRHRRLGEELLHERPDRRRDGRGRGSRQSARRQPMPTATSKS